MHHCHIPSCHSSHPDYRWPLSATAIYTICVKFVFRPFPPRFLLTDPQDVVENIQPGVAQVRQFTIPLCIRQFLHSQAHGRKRPRPRQIPLFRALSAAHADRRLHPPVHRLLFAHWRLHHVLLHHGQDHVHRAVPRDHLARPRWEQEARRAGRMARAGEGRGGRAGRAGGRARRSEPRCARYGERAGEEHELVCECLFCDFAVWRSDTFGCVPFSALCTRLD